MPIPIFQHAASAWSNPCARGDNLAASSAVITLGHTNHLTRHARVSPIGLPPPYFAVAGARATLLDKAELPGTCYFEFLPGEYKKQHWNDGSVFLAEDVFGLIEPIFARHEPRFDHWSFVGIRRQIWELIIADLERLAERAERATGVGDLAGELGFCSPTTQPEFANEFRANADALAHLARELCGWVRQQLREHECVSVLGL